MENDRTLLDQIARNERVVTHRTFGTYVVRRPTNRVQGLIDTARTRSINKDLQTKDMVVDPETGKLKAVPAFLTKSSKMKLLAEHGEYTEADEKAILEAEREFREVCKELNDLGFEGTKSLLADFKTAYQVVLAKVGDKDVSEPLKVIFPMAEEFSKGVDLYDLSDLPSSSDDKEFAKAKKAVEKALKDMEVVSMLNEVQKLHKQYGLVLRGLAAQSKLFILRMREMTLFADTVESRADYVSRLNKIFHCTYKIDGNKAWASQDACDDSNPDLLNWLLTEIEKFERLDPEDPEDTTKDKFNFLFQLGVTKGHLDELRDPPSPNTDGEQAETLQASSSEG